jgi:hypothetical protein
VIPKELRKYKEVFELPERPELVEGVEYKIKIEKDPPFGLIYNLSSYELSILYIYLDNALEKG